MGKGIDAARGTAPLHAQLMDDLKDQLLIVLLKRLGESLDIPCAEIDATGQDTLAVSVDFPQRMFHFEIRRKQ